MKFKDLKVGDEVYWHNQYVHHGEPRWLKAKVTAVKRKYFTINLSTNMEFHIEDGMEKRVPNASYQTQVVSLADYDELQLAIHTRKVLDGEGIYFEYKTSNDAVLRVYRALYPEKS